MRRARPKHRHGAGFTYVGLIIVVAIIALVAASTVKLGALLARRAAEEELLEIGAAFCDALKSYADASAPGQRQQPATLEELLRDPRSLNVRRHLRKLFVDPITGEAKWGLLRAPDKIGIVGVYSLSDAQPIKLANFDARFVQFENRQHLSDWKFMSNGLAAAPAQGEGAVPRQLQQPKEGEVPLAPPVAAQEPPAQPMPSEPPAEPAPTPEAPPADTAPPVEPMVGTPPNPDPPVGTDPIPIPGTVPVPKKKQ
jgi:type II secretory pathway pseudopilin PulG